MFAGLDVGSALAHFQLHQIRWINARITRRTEPARGITDRAAQGRQRNVAQRISAKEFADFLGRVGRGDQLFERGRVHAVVAGRNRRRATDAHVNFFRADFTDHADDFAAGSAAHNGVVDKYYTLTFDQAANGIELELHAEIADGLRRLDESSADEGLANQAHAEGDFRYKRVGYARGHAGIRHRKREVR